MRNFAMSRAQVADLQPCGDRFCELQGLWGDGEAISAADAVARGATLSDLIWIAAKVAKTDPDVERRLRLWLADCAAHVLHLFEAARPGDNRPRDAIETARRRARGDAASDTASDTASAAASAAAWDAVGDAARAAARDAASAAASAAAWDAAWDAVGDAARGAAWAAARAAARDAEGRWQLDRLVARLSNEEPADWPLPVRTGEEVRP